MNPATPLEVTARSGAVERVGKHLFAADPTLCEFGGIGPGWTPKRAIARLSIDSMSVVEALRHRSRTRRIFGDSSG